MHHDWRRGKKLDYCKKNKFTRYYNGLNESITNYAEMNIILSKFNDLTLLWEDVQENHDNYLIAKYPNEEGDANEEEEKWLIPIEEKFEIMQKAKCNYFRDLEEERQNSS